MGKTMTRAELEQKVRDDVNLSGANLGGADLSAADLRGAYLRGAYLRAADLHAADLRDADLSGAYLDPHAIAARQIVPLVGAFEAWKKVKGAGDAEYVLRLAVPDDAGRVGGLTGRKCRVSRAKVIAAYAVGTDGETTGAEFFSLYSPAFKYTVGETVTPDTFDSDPRTVCAQGIHCYITREDAEAHL